MNEPKTYWEPDDEEKPYVWDPFARRVEEDDEDDVDSEPPPRPGNTFVAWCPVPDRLDALIAIISALGGDSTRYEMRNPDDPNGPTLFLNQPDAIGLMRRDYLTDDGTEPMAGGCFEFRGRFNRLLNIGVNVRAAPENWSAPIEVEPRCQGYETWRSYLLFHAGYPQRKQDEPYAVEIAARLAWEFAIPDAIEILSRFCAAGPAIVCGGCVDRTWAFPLTNAASYHSDGYAARDLAMSWFHYNHDYPDLRLSAGFSIQELREDVESSQRGSSVDVLDGERLTREEVLAAMDLPPEDLLAALRVCAAKIHPQWQAIEGESKRLLDEIAKTNEEDVEWLPLTDDHIRFLKEHSPAFVTRLDNGAVVLFAHPYRTLWPLWSSALDLLGIRPRTT